MANFPSDFHICIVGAGIVGTACAVALRRQGFRITVVEKDKTLQTVSNLPFEAT